MDLVEIQPKIEDQSPIIKKKFIATAEWKKHAKRLTLLLAFPLAAAGTYLGTHTSIITDNTNKPYALAVVPSAVASIVLGWLLVTFFKTIISWCKSAWSSFNAARKEDGGAQFFWIVIIVFMIVSVFASGSFFSILEKNAVPGLGYVTALFIDLVAVQAMRARLNAVRMHDKKGAKLYLFGVLLCAGASAFANVYTSLGDFVVPKNAGVLPVWMILVAPWFGLVFPALILLLSMTADYTIDQISSKLDPENYKKQEAKKTLMLQYQAEAMAERAKFEKLIDGYAPKKEKRTFVLINLLFPVRKAQENFSTAEIENIKKDILETIENQSKMLIERTDFLYQTLEKLDVKSQKSGLVFESLFNNFSSQYDADLQLIASQFSELFASIDSQKNALENVAKSVLEKSKNTSKLTTTGDLDKLPQTDPNLYLMPQAKVTQKLTPEQLAFGPKSEEKEQQKETPDKSSSARSTTTRMTSTRLTKNLYTNGEAARAANCKVADIEEAIKSESLSLAKNSNKILKSSLEKFIQTNREKRTQKVAG